MMSGVFTVIAFLSFLGIAVWAYSRSNRARFEDASLLPLLDDAAPRCGGEGCGCANKKETRP